MPGTLELEFNPPGLDPVQHPLLDKHGVSLRILRLDQVHPLINGNKWFKLTKNLSAIKESGQHKVVSFGGAYSNHLLALAAAGKLLGIETIGIVRGEISDPLNPVLTFLREQGMELHAISREDYRKKGEPGFLEEISRRFDCPHILPEGGSNQLAVEGCREIADHILWNAAGSCRMVFAACGTGATLAGLILGLSGQQRTRPDSGGLNVRGVSVLKAPGYLQGEVSRWLNLNDFVGGLDWLVLDDYHCGGYAKTNKALVDFIADFHHYSAIPIEPVYSGKMLYGLFQQIASGEIAPGTDIVAIHSGGLLP